MNFARSARALMRNTHVAVTQHGRRRVSNLTADQQQYLDKYMKKYGLEAAKHDHNVQLPGTVSRSQEGTNRSESESDDLSSKCVTFTNSEQFFVFSIFSSSFHHGCF